MITIKEFSRKYDLDIIPVSYEDLTLGKCVWDAGVFGKPKFSHGSMPDYVFSTFVSAGLMSLEDADDTLNRFRAQPLRKAAFFNVNIDIETSVAVDLELDDATRLKNEVKSDKIVKFTFSDIRYKEIEFKERFMMDEKLDRIKQNHWKEYDQDLRRAYLVTQLYYGTIKVYIKKEFENQLNLTTKGFTLKGDVTSDSILEYEFNNSDLPFSMRLSRIKHFN